MLRESRDTNVFILGRVGMPTWVGFQDRRHSQTLNNAACRVNQR